MDQEEGLYALRNTLRQLIPMVETLASARSSAAMYAADTDKAALDLIHAALRITNHLKERKPRG